MINKNIILGITGSIAAYKSPDIVRRLREAGATVKVVMTDAAKSFITPLTLQAVAGNRVHDNLLSPESEAAMGHIELARWADLVLIAPASANFIACLAHGYANGLLTTLCLATTAPIAIAPAMNQQMWENKIVQRNVRLLCDSDQRISLLGPGSGSQACGEFGPGRMLEPDELIILIKPLFGTEILAGKNVVITAGPTQEAIDPVRYLTNRSSGKMGYALAQAAREAGASVTLISGPTQLPCPPNVNRISVMTAQEMYNQVMTYVSGCDIFIANAAVSDYRLENIASQKIKKTDKTLTLRLERNPDILSAVAALPHPPFTVGFAAETENLVAYAKKKLNTKKIDIIIANIVGPEQGFDQDKNAVTVITPTNRNEIPATRKTQLAQQLIKIIGEHSA
ncbi:MAG: bifunctional phosphopantothenoylcysteine decarboxylase/phosphopantothenate--cysteine ligase CoaBC [Gammaproteobacteria bacterium]